MRRPRDVALHAGFYLAATLTGLAAAYVLKEWIYHIWDTRQTPRIDISDKPDAPPQPESDPAHIPELPGPSDEPAPEPVLPAPIPEPDPPSSTNQTLPKMLPPLRVNSLLPPTPTGGALLSESFCSINPDSLTSPTPHDVHSSPYESLVPPYHTPSYEEGLDGDVSSQTTASDTDSFVDVLSPPPPAQVITRRRSFFRNHDLFAESHMSFSQLGSLVAPEIDSESD